MYIENDSQSDSNLPASLYKVLFSVPCVFIANSLFVMSEYCEGICNTFAKYEREIIRLKRRWKEAEEG